ncbi:uncharacterized protein PG986_002147 [Apiospora aurea]|uniref:Nephrocystin 3-like N-terminal domain-containing protein n=1 Tax=Apiospora aurea TaxID=335848 RepID=A0ABR1QYV6_9PEZI
MSPPRKRAREDNSDSDDEQLEAIHPEDVTIAIFYALAYESVAVKYTLDEELECPPKTTGRGSYIYSFGRIKEHNIVIARPVDMGPRFDRAKPDISSEKQVTQQFTNVRFALMVGISASIPSDKVDIRLGDVAISVPRDNYPGVVQYDFGKFELNSNFTTKGCLNAPPRIFISAISALEEDEIMHKRLIKKILRRLAKEDMFARPTNGDILFDPEFRHQIKGSDCSACQSASDVKVVARCPRRAPDQPYVHRGLILSGGGVIKNPKDRERLRRGYKDTICFEMEAASIINEIPCLHYYTAAAAASYYKAVLLKTDLECSIITERLHNIDTKVEGLKQGISLKNIRRWLSAPDPAANFNKARVQHQEGTGEWLVQSAASSIVADLKQNSAISRSLLYFYFGFNDEEKQSHDRALRSLITQLYEKRQDLREAVDTLHSTCFQGGQQPSVDSLRMLFQRLLWQASETWIVLDALDECPIRNGLLLWIDGLREAGMSIHILVTSRPEQDIKAVFENFCSENQIIYMQTDMAKDDINAYIRTRTRKMDRWKNLPKVQREIKSALISGADGMFRWVACQFEILNDCLDRPSIQRELANLPSTLYETYTRILNSIDKKYQHHTKRLLQFLLYSTRPLRLEEAVDALAVDTAAPHRCRYMFYAPDHYIQPPDGTAQRVVSYPAADPRRISALYYASCTGLVHSATRLLQKGAALETKCGEFGTALHAAALYGETLLVEKLLENGAPIDARSQMFGTALQAVAGFGEESMMKLLLENGAAIDAWSEICGTALEFASGEGRMSNVKLLLEMGAEIGYALHAAARSGHKDIIRLLLDMGAKLDMRDDYGFTPLRWAEIKRQPVEVMELLGHQDAQKATSPYNG